MRRIPGITRYEYKGSCGWLARYYGAEKTYQRLFSDSRYGDAPARSRTAARRYLQQLARQVPPRLRLRTRPTVRTRSGRVGVCLRGKRERNGRVFWCYDVSYTREGRRRTTSFRVHLYPSQRLAFLTACLFRAQMERAMQQERWAARKQ